MAQLAVSEEANADPVVPPTTSLPQVTVEAAPAASGGFEEFAAGKRVIGRARLQASAAGSALEFLKQEPGLTVTADGRIGLMGLPNYTQVLVDGKPPQPGNNLDKLTLDQIERIEIVRAATAELGPFGVAGSINVVMRRVARKPSESLALTGSGGEGRKGASFTWTKNQELRPEAWSLRLRVTGSTRDLASETETRWEGLGAPPSEHRSDFTRAQFFIVSVDNQLRGPELGRAELDVSAVLLRNEGEHDGCTEAGRCVSSRVTGYTQGLNYGLKWTRSDASLNEWRIGFSGTHNKSGTDLSQRLQAGTPGEQLLWHDHSNDYAFHFADVTWIPALPKEHDLKLGWKWRGVRDRMSGFELQDGVPVSATAAFGASRHVAGQRVEGFVQHDWRPLPQWATSVGLSWTQQRDRITEGDYHAEPQWQLFAPSANLAWKTGEGARQQWRLSLARTFKKPERDEQLQRPRLHPEASCPSLTLCTPNQVDQPDITGNPALQPERAHGLNLSFEQRWNDDTELTVDAYARQIDGVIAQVLRQQTVVWSAVPRWVLRPENLGEAWTRGLDLGLRWRQVFSDWAPISMTLGVQMVRSRLKTLPGPDNRLADQQPWGLKLGLRQKLKSMPVEWGVDWSAQPGSWTQVDATRSIYQTRMRNLDADANWQLRKDAKLVLNLRNLSRQGKDQMQRILLRQDLWRQTSRQVGYPSLSLRLDLTL